MMGLSALPEFYSEAGQLVDLPFAKAVDVKDEPVVSPFLANAYARVSGITLKTPSPQPLAHGRFERNGALKRRGAKSVEAESLPPLSLYRERGLGGEGSSFNTELITGRPPAPHFHSWTHYFCQAQEMWPQLYCQIHPEKAESLGITDGDQVKVETESGELEARAWVYGGIRKTAVFVPIG